MTNIRMYEYHLFFKYLVISDNIKAAIIKSGIDIKRRYRGKSILPKEARDRKGNKNQTNKKSIFRSPLIIPKTIANRMTIERGTVR